MGVKCDEKRQNEEESGVAAEILKETALQRADRDGWRGCFPFAFD